MKEINLENSEKKAQVDDEDYGWVSKHKWYLVDGISPTGRKMKYAARYDEAGNEIYMHDEIMNRHKLN